MVLALAAGRHEACEAIEFGLRKIRLVAVEDRVNLLPVSVAELNLASLPRQDEIKLLNGTTKWEQSGGVALPDELSRLV